MLNLNHLSQILTALVFPHYCPVCQNDWSVGRGFMCEECWQDLPLYGAKPDHSNGRREQKFFIRYAYSDTARILVHKLKFSGRRDIADRLGQELGRYLADSGFATDCQMVIPVPLHPARVRERGYNQSALLARQLSEILNLPIHEQLLKRLKNTAPQSRLPDLERKNNLQKAFQTDPTFSVSLPESVLLVDDVLHTGATVRGCIEALNQKQIRKVTVVAAFG